MGVYDCGLIVRVSSTGISGRTYRLYIKYRTVITFIVPDRQDVSSCAVHYRQSRLGKTPPETYNSHTAAAIVFLQATTIVHILRLSRYY